MMNDWIKERGRTLAIIGAMVAIGTLILGFLYAILSSLNAQRAEMVQLGVELRNDIRETRVEMREIRVELRDEIRENREEQREENRETREELRYEIRENRGAIGGNSDAIDELRGDVNEGFEHADERIDDNQKDASRRIDAANGRIDDVNERADDLSKQIYFRSNPPDGESAPVEEDFEG